MPLYDFKSPCGATFEKLVRHGAPVPPCPCGAPLCLPQAQIGAPAFALKGSGWSDKGRPAAGRALHQDDGA